MFKTTNSASYKTRSDIIKEEVKKLCMKYSQIRDGDLQNAMRLISRNGPIVSIMEIESAILETLKRENYSQEKLSEVSGNIRTLTNQNLERHTKMLIFLWYTSNKSDSFTYNSSTRFQTFGSSMTERNQSASSNSNIANQQNNSNRLNLRSHKYRISNELTEYEVIGDILYIIMGVNGQYIEWNAYRQVLETKENYILPVSMYVPTCKLIQSGIAFKLIKSYINNGIISEYSGVVKQGFCAALNEYLKAYINMVANLQSKYRNWTLELEFNGNNMTDSQSDNFLTLERLIYNLQEPMRSLIFIVSLIESAGNAKGGPLASVIYSFLPCGDPFREKLIRKLLLSAVEPFYEFIQQWIYDGTTEENQEFFIALNTNYDIKCHLSEKYGLIKKFLPKFITNMQSHKILETGREINFLREVCREQTQLKTNPIIQKTIQVKAESMVNQDIDHSFDTMINTVYAETSKILLDVMFNKFQLMDHFTALRKFLLHGQGDFIVRLLELVGMHLSVSGSDVHQSTLDAAMLEAIRTTNAQFLPTHIQSRVIVQLSKISDFEKGWDIFTLSYEFSDVRPLFTFLSQTTMQCYMRAFLHLFRGRRVHFILNNMFKEHRAYRQQFSQLSDDINPVWRLIYGLVQEKLHFVNQIQYYINFEVLECSWKKFMDDLSRASNLNEVINHHSCFLSQVTSRLMLEEQSRDVITNLRTIYNDIILFEDVNKQIIASFHSELQRRISYDNKISYMQSAGNWGVNNRVEAEESNQRSLFRRKTVYDIIRKLKTHHNLFESNVVKFLQSLSNQKDASLRCLCTNLDFNEQYKSKLRVLQQTAQIRMN